MDTNLIFRPDFLDGLNTITPWRAWVTNIWETPAITDGSFPLEKNKTYEIPLGELEAGDYCGYVDVTRANSFEYVDAYLSPAEGSSIGRVKIFSFEMIQVAERVVLKGGPTTLTAGEWFLRISGGNTQNPYRGGIKFYGARLDMQAEPDDLGVFSGSTPDTDTAAYAWSGEPYASASTVTTKASPPEPAAGPVARVLTLTSQTGDVEAETLATESVNIIQMLVRAYTRGRGFTTTVDPETSDVTTEIADDIQAVIVTATVRLMSNVSQLAYTAGSETVRDAFKGWSLAETLTLNNYRRRWN